jgi:tRNA (cmo5U34)-methyltransferase
VSGDRDKVFTKPMDRGFEFDETVATVFDDMMSRSVPFYDEVLNLIVDLVSDSLEDGGRVLDIGSSTAKFLLTLHSKSKTPLELIGIDNSSAMIERATKKCKAFGADRIELVYQDILSYEIDDFDLIISNYTLQFIRPIQRPKLIEKIFNGLKSGGEFYFSEKVVFEERVLDRKMIDIYYKYKREQGYSEYEIATKREALENVLIPFTVDENIKMCRDAGFKKIDTIFQWANFVTFRAKKCGS